MPVCKYYNELKYIFYSRKNKGNLFIPWYFVEEKFKLLTQVKNMDDN